MKLEGVGKSMLLLENGPLTACAFQEASDNQPECPQDIPPQDSLRIGCCPRQKIKRLGPSLARRGPSQEP
jgi:hypothetical protein